jgi:DNA primase
LMQYEGLEFVDTIEELAKNAGLEVPRSADTKDRKPRNDLYDSLEKTAAWFQAQLKENPSAIDYLKNRGLSGEICRDFGVGYAPASWDALQKHLGTDDKALKLMQRGGLLSQGKGKAYDKFRDRIMFPIHDRRGRVIAFGGRAMADDGPKYLNSPETELFHKGRELYGLYLARKRVGRLDTIIVVEGYTDVVALAQFGLRNTVATLGTATTSDHVELLFRASETVIFCFDGDKAGRKAGWRALEATLPRLREGLQAKFLFLPDGEDPDSLVRKKGKEEFEKLISESQPLSDYLFEHFMLQVDMESIDGRAKLVQLALPLLQSLPEGVFKNMMMERLETLARHRLNQQSTSPVATTQTGSRVRPAQSRTPLRLALAYLVQNPGLSELVGDLEEIVSCDLHGVDIFIRLVDFCRNRPNMTTAQVMEILRDDPVIEHLGKLAIWNLPGDSNQQELEFSDSVNGIRLLWIDALLARMPRISDLSAEQKVEYRALQQRQQALKQSLQGNNN